MTATTNAPTQVPAPDRPRHLARASRRVQARPAAGSGRGHAQPVGHAPALLGRRTGKETGRDRRLHRGWPEPRDAGDERLGRPGPAWWLNLQAHPEATVELPGGTRRVVGPRGGGGGA